jgi:PAS domain S-box-containing protein
MIGKSVFDFLSDPSDREKIQTETEMRKTGNSSMYEMFIVRKNDGALRKISVVATPFLDQNNNFYSTLGFVKDITEHHESIQEILKKEKIGRVKNSLYEAVH